MEKFRLIPLLTAAVMGCTALLAGCGKGSDSSSKAEEGAKTSDDGSINKDLTATELARLLGNGTNLGNTMEAYGHKSYSADTDPESFETLWGQPVTTEEMIKGMKASGFDSLRVPVAWTNAMEYEKGDYTINEAYLDRVEEIINYALDNDMYVIINDHWDGSWWGMFGSSEQSDVDKAFEMYKSMWTQIANRYKKYSDRLIFEGANEELGDRLNDTDSSNEYADGKWRFMFYDIEFGGVSGEGDAWTNTMKEDNYKPKGLLDTDTKNPAVLSFAYLMSNEDFRNDFNDRLLKMSEGTFEKEKALDRLAEFESIYSPLYEQFFARYPETGSAEEALHGGYASSDCIRAFINKRDKSIQSIVDWTNSQF